MTIVHHADNGYEIRYGQIWNNVIFGVDKYIITRDNVVFSYHDTQDEAEAELARLGVK